MCWQVATYTAILDRDLSDKKKTAEEDISTVVSASYSSLATAELQRRLKAVPVAFYAQPPSRLFDASATADFVGWAF